MQLPCLWKSRILSEAVQKIKRRHMGKHTAPMLNKTSNLLTKRQNLITLHACIFTPSDPKSSKKAALKLLTLFLSKCQQWQMYDQ